jgi:hypothetical protein
MVNVLWKPVPKEIPERCDFIDREKDRESEEIQKYAKMACALWVMGINMKSFNPNVIVTRDQFGTILSRVLWWREYNILDTNNHPYYEEHLKALKKNWIMTQIENPTDRIEIRKWIWIMLKRSQEDWEDIDS